jgi:hypothetical protein
MHTITEPRYAAFLLDGIGSGLPQHGLDEESARLSRILHAIGAWGGEGQTSAQGPAWSGLADQVTRDIVALLWRRWSALDSTTQDAPEGEAPGPRVRYLCLLVAQLPHVLLPCLPAYLARLDEALRSLASLPPDVQRVAYDVCTAPQPIDYVRREGLLRWYLRLRRHALQPRDRGRSWASAKAKL